MYIPLPEQNGRFANRFMIYCCSQAESYFPISVLFDDESDYKTDSAYIVAALPLTAETLMQCLVAAISSTWPQCFSAPLVRHVYWWNGIRPVTRQCMKKLLSHNRCVVLVPGGVQECLFMQKDSETAFLKNRKGFIRLAMQTGAAVVPCFAFGQGGTYSWWRPGPPLLSESFVQAMSRRIGFVPLMLAGRWGSHIPHKSRMTVALGKPIAVPHLDSPPDELLQQYLDKFIQAMQELFDKHKATAGYPDYKLHIM
eukprot:gene8038-8233_t